MVFKEYAVTVKIQKTDKIYLACDYDQIILDLMQGQSYYGCELDIVDSVYELDKLGKVHYHGIWICKKGIPRYRSFNHKGCTCSIKEVYYRSGWTNYMKKDIYNDLFIEVNSKSSKHEVPVSSGSVTDRERGTDVSVATLKDLFS